MARNAFVLARASGASIKDLERTASRTAARGIYFGVNKRALFQTVKTWCTLFSTDILSAII